VQSTTNIYTRFRSRRSSSREKASRVTLLEHLVEGTATGRGCWQPMMGAAAELFCICMLYGSFIAAGLSSRVCLRL